MVQKGAAVARADHELDVSAGKHFARCLLRLLSLVKTLASGEKSLLYFNDMPFHVSR
jgi:hypothetical protein